MTVEIRALDPQNDRTSFRSGDEALDLFFRRYAGQNQFRHHVGVTYVAVGTEGSREILGFVTVSPAALEADALPSGRRMPPYPVPVLRIARLAVAESARGLGIGKGLFRFCVELAEKLQAEVGCVGIVVDAKPGAAGFYERFGFVPIGLEEGEAERRPRPSPMFLGLGSVPRP